MSAPAEKSAEEVAAQREIKKSEDTLRKLEAKINKAEDGPNKDKDVAEAERLRNRISELCAQFNLESKADRKAKGTAAGASDIPTTAAPSAPTAALSVATAVRVDPLKLVEELESVRSRLSTATEAKDIDELKTRFASLIDACVSVASAQASLATARASPAVVPQQHTPFQGPSHAATAMPAMDLLPKSDGAAASSRAAAAGGLSASSLAAVAASSPSAAGASSSPSVSGPQLTAASLANTVAYGGESTESDAVPDGIHPRFLDLAIRVRLLQVVGGNARALALLDAILAFVRTTKTLSEDLRALSSREKNAFLKQLSLNVEAVSKARPLCAAMTYVLNAVKTRIDYGEFTLQENNFVRDQVAAMVAEIGDGLLERTRKVSERTQEVRDDDVILTYGRSSSIEALLLNIAANLRRQAADTANNSNNTSNNNNTNTMKRLRVIVLDSPPLFEGRGLAKRLQANGIAVRYALASAACQLMPQCTKVFLGASAVMQSGDVVSRCGTALVAACAKTSQRPVFVFAEDHKFTPEVWIGSLTRNELVNAAFPSLAGQTAYQKRLFDGDEAPKGYLYDVTPSQLIDVVVTRFGRVHPTAAYALVMPEEKERDDRGGGAAVGGEDEDEDVEDVEDVESYLEEVSSRFVDPQLMR